MIARKFGRIVNITSGAVQMPLAGLDLSSGARAGLTAFLAGVARAVAANNVTINFLLPGAFDTDRLRSNIEANAKKQNVSFEPPRPQRINAVPARRFGDMRGVRRGLRVPVLGAGRLHHRPEHPDRRRRLSGGVLSACGALCADA